MANKNFNTQIRKKFDKGSEKPKSKDMMDRNPNRTMEPETIKRLRKLAKKKRKTSKAKQPIEKLPLKKEPLRKPSDRQQKDMRRTKELERRQFGKTSEDKKPRINKIKDKLNKVGNMKVKDAATAVAKATYKGALAGTPIGAAKNVTNTFKKNFKFQSPIVRKNKKFGGR